MSTDETTETVGLFDAARILGVSPQRADQLSRQVGFPDTVDTDVEDGRLLRRRKWLRSAVEAYAAARKPTTSTETQ